MALKHTEPDVEAPLFTPRGAHLEREETSEELFVQLKLERARLAATLDSLMDPHVIFEAVRDEDGRVIDTGNNVWVGDLRPCTNVGCAAPTLTKITNNILRAFGQGPAGVLQPPLPNTDSISPADS